MTTNPVVMVGMAASPLWDQVPDCVKGAIIDLILDLALALVEALPNTPMLGILWPILQPGIIGFLEGIRGQDTQTKLDVISKIGQIVSGESTGFIKGFAQGFLKGLWEGVTDPG